MDDNMAGVALAKRLVKLSTCEVGPTLRSGWLLAAETWSR